MTLRDVFIPFSVNGGNLRWKWCEVDFRWDGPRLSWEAWDYNHNTLVIGLTFVTLYFHMPRLVDGENLDGPGYGFYFSNDAFVVEIGKDNYFFHYPWSWNFYKRWELARGYGKDLIWIEIPHKFPYGQLGHKETAPYTYTLKSGEVQHRTATYYVDRMEWRWRWFKWLPWPSRKMTTIDVQFDGEVGERTGSWKGGCIGCSYEMKRNETPIQTLRRMERERVFK